MIFIKSRRAPARLGPALALLAMAAVVGCTRAPARAPAKEIPITGKITLDGNPLADAEVQFRNANFATFGGATDAAGVYKLWTHDGGEQVCEGPCQVTVSKFVLPAGVTPEPDLSPMVQGGEQVLPRKYWDMDNTMLQADVPKEGGTFDFPLESK